MGLATKLRWEKSLLSSGKAKRHFLLITLIERKSRVPLVRYRLTGEIQGVQGEAVVTYYEPLATMEMGYHRLSRRVNKMEKKKNLYNSSLR
jgi:hypothetical protein